MGILNLSVELLLMIGENLSIKDLSCFFSTCHLLSSTLFTNYLHNRFLRAKGACTVLQSAAKYNQISLAKLAISKGARVGCEIGPSGSGPRTPPALHMAARYNSPDVIRILFEHGAEIDALYGLNTPLSLATWHKSLKAVRVLLELGAKIPREPIDPAQEPPTHVAARSGDIDFMQAFVDIGFDFKSRGYNGETVLHVAICSGEKKMLEYLLQQEGCVAIIKAYDSNGYTPMHSAVLRCGGEGMVRLLLHYGANSGLIDWRDFRGNTPLHLAVRSNSEVEEKVRLLLRGGAKTGLRNYNGYTPADIAKICKMEVLHKMLLQGLGNGLEQEFMD